MTFKKGNPTRVALFCFAVLLLSGCAYNFQCTGSFKKGFICQTIRPQMDDVDMLRAELFNVIQHAGVQIFQVGDEVTLILPSDDFFLFHSNRLYGSSLHTLDYIAALLKTYKKTMIKISGYTDNWCRERNLALSQQQAKTIADYLWKHGIDTRLLFATGYAGCEPIASNKTDKGQTRNRRIEITFRQYGA